MVQTVIVLELHYYLHVTGRNEVTEMQSSIDCHWKSQHDNLLVPILWSFY